MTHLSKRVKAIKEKFVKGKLYGIGDAVSILKQCATAKFDESLDAAIVLGIDTRKEQGIRGSTVLPHGTGKTVRVAVFAQGDNAAKAKAAGADIVGFEDLVEKVKAGEINFDVVIATPDAMRIVGQIGQILGPRGLMPNPKVGTVTADVTGAVTNAKSGQVRYRADKSGIVHCSIGKIAFSPEAIQQNLEMLLVDLKKVKPAASKGIYLKKVVLSTTMGPGVVIDLSSLTVG